MIAGDSATDKPVGTVLLLLSVLSVFAFHAVVSAYANPVWATFLPQYPDRNPPEVDVSSPQEDLAYSADNVTLAFVVTEPDSWFRDGSYGSTKIGEVTSVLYSLDGLENQTLYEGSLNLDPTASHSWERSTRNFSVSLSGLGEGTHTVTIFAEGVTAFLPGQDEPFDISRIKVGSEPITLEFRVASSSEATQESEGAPFQLLPAAAVSVVVAAVVVGAVVITRKRKRSFSAVKLAVWVLTAVITMALFGVFVEAPSANFKPYAPPSIDISSPIPNQVYNSSKVILDVSATPVLSGPGNPIAYNNITSLNYSLDGQQDIRVPIGRSIYGIVLHEKFTLSNLSNGVHSVFVHGESTPYSIVPGYPSCSEKIPFNETVSFTVKLPGTSVSGPFPWLPVTTVCVAVVAVVAVSAVVYVKKRGASGAGGVKNP